MKYLGLLLVAIFFFIPKQVFATEIYTTEKLITVDTAKQRMHIWEGGIEQRVIIVSTGMYYTPTVKGNFRIQKKIEMQDMRGSFPPYKPYYIKDVPHVMYFYGAYAIHGTHWHTKFGTRQSHGCVNLSIADAKWVYDWANVGTRVVVY